MRLEMNVPQAAIARTAANQRYCGGMPLFALD